MCTKPRILHRPSLFFKMELTSKSVQGQAWQSERDQTTQWHWDEELEMGKIGNGHLRKNYPGRVPRTRSGFDQAVFFQVPQK